MKNGQARENQRGNQEWTIQRKPKGQSRMDNPEKTKGAIKNRQFTVTGKIRQKAQNEDKVLCVVLCRSFCFLLAIVCYSLISISIFECFSLSFTTHSNILILGESVQKINFTASAIMSSLKCDIHRSLM